MAGGTAVELWSCGQLSWRAVELGFCGLQEPEEEEEEDENENEEEQEDDEAREDDHDDAERHRRKRNTRLRRRATWTTKAGLPGCARSRSRGALVSRIPALRRDDATPDRAPPNPLPHRFDSISHGVEVYRR